MFFLIFILPFVILFQIQTIVAYKISQDSIMLLKNKNTTDCAVTEALRKLCFGISVFWIGFLVFLVCSILFRNIGLLNIIFVFLTITCFGDLIITSCIYLPVLKKYNKGYYKKVILRSCAMILILILIVFIKDVSDAYDISIVRYHEYIASESDYYVNLTLIDSQILGVKGITEDDLAGYKNGDLLLIVHSPMLGRHDVRFSSGLSKGEIYRDYIGSYLTNTNVPVGDESMKFFTNVSFIIKLADGTEDDITFVERESDGSKAPSDVY